MTTLPALNYVSNSARTQGEVKASLEATNTFIRDKFGSESTGWTDVASATTTDIGAASSDNVRITGTTTITGLGTVAAGVRRNIRFAGSLTFTHNGTSLILPGGANITTAANDTCEAISLGSGNWIVVAYQRAAGVISNVAAGNGASVSISNGTATVSAGPTLGTALATTSGTAIDFTSIPSWVKRVAVMFSGVSISGTDNILIQLGNSGGVVSTGYVSVGTVTAGSTSATAGTSGFLIAAGNAGYAFHGHITFLNMNGNVWTGIGAFANTATSTYLASTAGSVDISSTLDRVRITTSGSNTFDAGTINIMYE